MFPALKLHFQFNFQNPYLVIRYDVLRCKFVHCSTHEKLNKNILARVEVKVGIYRDYDLGQC